MARIGVDDRREFDRFRFAQVAPGAGITVTQHDFAFGKWQLPADAEKPPSGQFKARSGHRSRTENDRFRDCPLGGPPIAMDRKPNVGSCASGGAQTSGISIV